jgi:hypothetical protein
LNKIEHFCVVAGHVRAEHSANLASLRELLSFERISQYYLF